MYTMNKLTIPCHKGYSLAEASYQLYEEIAEDYIRLDQHRGDDMDVILEAVNEKKGLTILDAGCGPGYHIERCLQLVPDQIDRMLGLDFSMKMLEYAKAKVKYGRKVKLIEENILNIGLPDSSVDTILSMNNVLGNLIVDGLSSAEIARKNGLSQFYRILRKKGKCVLSVYNLDTLDYQEDYCSDSILVEEDSSFPENGDLVVKITERQKELRYYSHWFKIDEVVGLLSGVGFTTLHCISREKRILVIGEKS